MRPEELAETVRESRRNYAANLDLIESILFRERSSEVTRKPFNEDVISLCSGGLDSVVMISYVIETFNSTVHPLFIKRGAKAEKHEEASFDFFTDFYRSRFREKIGRSFKLSAEVPLLCIKSEFPKENALVIGHPMRNSTMENLAVSYAVALEGKYRIHARTILVGSVEEDGDEPENGLLSLRAQTLNTCIQMGSWEWQITSPFTDNYLGKRMSKADLIRYASEKGIPLEKTRTCFSSEELADRTCFACVKRMKAFKKAGMEDNGH